MEYFFSGDEENLLASIVKLDFSISVAFSLTKKKTKALVTNP